jgi:outer membrane lipoprotein LolB
MSQLRFSLMLVFLLGLAVLAGCAAPPVSDAQAKAIDTLGTLNRSGRFAMRAEVFGRNPEAVQGGFVWRDRGQVLTLDLTNPMGTVLARVEVGPQGALMQESNGNITRAPHPDALIRQVIGQEIPVSGLRSWMRGQPADGSSAENVARTSGHLSKLRQNGWSIELSRYDDLGPRLLVLTRQDGERTVTLRLVIDQN